LLISFLSEMTYRDIWPGHGPTIPNRKIAKEQAMNWDQIQGKWKEFKGQAKQQWGKLTDDDLAVVAGKRDELVGKVQERYGIAKEEAEEQVREFEDCCRC
jgi:uncharacterized protein YjbJ (UPF0337 family)